MFFPPLCLEAFGFSFHKAPFVGRVKNAFEGNQIPRSILTVSALGVNEFLITKGAPIKRPSVKVNTSPGEETIIVSLLRHGRAVYSLRHSLFFAFAGMFLRRGRGAALWIFTAPALIRIKMSAPAQ